MKTTLRSILVLFLLMLCVNGIAQENKSTTNYIDDVKEKALIFRGPLEQPFTGVRIGTQYAYSDLFLKGEIEYHGKRYSDVLLNLNAYSDQICMKISANSNTIVLKIEDVDYVKFGEREYVYLKDHQLLKDGYYQIVYSGDESAIYKKIVKYMEKKLNSKDYIEYKFSEETAYYYVKGDRLQRIKKRSFFKREFPEKKNDIKQFFKNNSISYKNNKDIIYNQLMVILDAR